MRIFSKTIVIMFLFVFCDYLVYAVIFDETDAQVNVSGGLITMSTQGAFDADGNTYLNGTEDDSFLYFNMTAMNPGDSTVAPVLSIDHSGTGKYNNGLDIEFNPEEDGLLVTSKFGHKSNFDIGVKFVGVDEDYDFLHEMYDYDLDIFLEVKGRNGLQNDIEDDGVINFSNLYDISFEVLDEMVIPDGRPTSTLTQDSVNHVLGAECVLDLDLGLDLLDSSNFFTVSELASGEEPSSKFYQYRSYHDDNINGVFDDGDVDIVGDNYCLEFGINIFPLIELNPNEYGVVPGVFTGVFVFDLTIY